MPYNSLKRDNPAQPHRIMLTGTALLNAVDAMEAEGKSRSEQCRACGYEIDGKLHFTNFYTAILDARGYINQTQESEAIKAEDPDNQEAIDAALENYSADVVAAFIELYGEENVESIEDSYQGEFESGAHFAEYMVSDCYCLDIPSFVVVDWEATWDQLYYDYSIEDGYVFCDNF